MPVLAVWCHLHKGARGQHVVTAGAADPFEEFPRPTLDPLGGSIITNAVVVNGTLCGPLRIPFFRNQDRPMGNRVPSLRVFVHQSRNVVDARGW